MSAAIKYAEIPKADTVRPAEFAVAESGVTVDRRMALRLAAGVALAAPGCMQIAQPDEREAKPSQPQPTPETPGKATRRLFTIHVDGSTKWEERSPINEKWHELSGWTKVRGDLLNAWSAVPGDVKPQFVAWLTPKHAAELRQVEGVKKVVAHKPGDPVKVTIGPLRQQLTEKAGDGKRNLIVILGPNSWSNSTDVSDFQPDKEIAEQWATDLKSVEGVKVEAIKAAKWDVINKAGVHIGPRPGQIRIVVEGESVPEKVLKTIQSHPQTEKLQWDHAEVIYKCPPCGRG